MPNFQRDSILNGNNSIAVFKNEGLVYRNESIEEFFSFTVKDVTAFEKKELKFPSNLQGWYQITTAMTAHSLDVFGSKPGEQNRNPERNCRCLWRAYDNQIIKQAEPFDILQGRYSNSLLYFNANYQNELYTDTDVLEITFFCLPIYVTEGGVIA